MIEMVVGRDYLLKKTRGPYAAKHFLNTRVVPVMVNAAGNVEVMLDRMSQRTRIRPLVLLGFGALAVAGAFGLPDRRGRAASPGGQ